MQLDAKTDFFKYIAHHSFPFDPSFSRQDDSNSTNLGKIDRYVTEIWGGKRNFADIDNHYFSIDPLVDTVKKCLLPSESGDKWTQYVVRTESS
jgi:hypothetical protein